MRFLISLGTIALLLSPVVAWSQEPPAIVPGSRIRIAEPGSKPRSGTVVTAGADTVVLRLDSGGETTAFSLARISGLEVSRGRKGHVAAGVGLGFLAGVGIGALLGAVFAPESASNSEEGIYPYVGIGAVVGAGAGMLVGGVVGARLKSDKWEAVPSSRWRVSTLPTGPGGFALALSVRF